LTDRFLADQIASYQHFIHFIFKGTYYYLQWRKTHKKRSPTKRANRRSRMPLCT